MNTNITKRKINNGNKTVKNIKSSNENVNTAQYYDNNFYNKETLPITSIIKYINNNYGEYLRFINNVSGSIKIISSLNFYFDIKNILINNSKIVNINQVIKKKPSVTLNKFISYMIYIKSKDYFKNNNKFKIEDLKFQIGNDSDRLPIFINGDLYKNRSIDKDKDSYYKFADYYILTLVEYLNKLNTNIDYNLVNQICILTCQNTFNVLYDCIVFAIMSSIAPQIAALINNKQIIKITLTENKKEMRLIFSSNISISYQQILDPEVICGKINYTFVIDFLKSTYYFEEFQLKYNVDKCNPSYQLENKGDDDDDDDNESENNKPVDNSKPSNNANAGNVLQIKNKSEPQSEKQRESKLTYLLPITGISGGLVSTPFILGALGGKKHNKTMKKSRRKLK